VNDHAAVVDTTLDRYLPIVDMTDADFYVLEQATNMAYVLGDDYGQEHLLAKAARFWHLDTSRFSDSMYPIGSTREVTNLLPAKELESLVIGFLESKDTKARDDFGALCTL